MPQFDITADAWTEIVAAGGTATKEIRATLGEALIRVGPASATVHRLGGSGSQVAYAYAGLAVNIRPVAGRVVVAMGDASPVGGTPTPTPTPAPSFTSQPSISPTSGTTGQTFTGSDGTIADGAVSAREWLLGGSVVGTGATYAPSAAGSLTYRVTATGQGGTASATSAAVAVSAAAPPAMLAGSRFNQMGFNGYAGSDGTDTDSNSRIFSFNETGATIVKARAYFANWFADATNERDAYNPITVTAAIEYPAGTFTPLTFGGAASVVIANGVLAESDEATLATAIPAGVQYWVRTFVSVGAGLKWPQGYLVVTAAGEAQDFSTTVDKTTAGTITNTTGSAVRRAYGPIAVKATAMTGAPVARAYAGIGDSITMGSSDAGDSIAIARGNIGYVGKAIATRYPYINLGIAGTKATDNLPANFTRRLNLLQKIGITHIIGNWAVNDIGAGLNAATIKARVEQITAGLKAGLPNVKIVWNTATPRTSSTDVWKTTANQAPFATPAGGYTGGTSSVRSQYNASLRAGFANVDYVFDAADASETARDSGIWRAGEGSTHLTNTGANSDAMTNDGQHPTAFNTAAPGLGGIYVLRDALIADLPRLA